MLSHSPNVSPRGGRRAGWQVRDPGWGRGERGRPSNSARHSRPPRREGSAEQRHSVAAASVPALRRGSPSPAARAGWLLAPRRGREGSEGPQGRAVNSPQYQQSRPRPRLPGAEVPPRLRLCPAPGLHFPECPRGSASGFAHLLDYISQNAARGTVLPTSWLLFWTQVGSV